MRDNILVAILVLWIVLWFASSIYLMNKRAIEHTEAVANPALMEAVNEIREAQKEFNEAVKRLMEAYEKQGVTTLSGKK